MRNLFWGIILVAAGAFLLLDNLGIADFGEVMGTYWPLIIIAWGASILMRKSVATPSPETQTDPYPPALEQDLLHQSNVFGDLSLIISSQNLRVARSLPSSAIALST